MASELGAEALHADATDGGAEADLTLRELITALNAEDADTICSGLKRARNQFMAQRPGPVTAAGGATAASPSAGAPAPTLLAQYLDASPEAAELFAIWGGLKMVRAGR